MPIDLDKANSNKEKIISTITTRGPSLPVHLSQATQLSPLFSSAFLSELYAEGKIKISNMKVGSSPLYYIQGQEQLLENFIDYLNVREKEAFHLLKNSKVLEDETQTPVVRIALRAIKDFAIPMRISAEGKEKLYWKYFLLSDQEFNSLIEKPQKHKKDIKEEVKEKSTQIKLSINELKENIKETEQLIKPLTEEIKEGPPKKEPAIKEKPKRKPKKPVESKFINDIKDYLSAKDIEILDIIEEKKKDLIAKVRIDTLFGKQEYFLIAKDKKKISENDLTYAIQKANDNKMLALIITQGELDKKAYEHHKSWKNLVKFEKVKL